MVGKTGTETTLLSFTITMIVIRIRPLKNYGKLLPNK